MDDDEEKRPDWPAMLVPVDKVRPRAKFAIPTVATVRVCEHIEPDQARGDDYVTLDRKYAGLTQRLPLRGGSAMVRVADGATRLATALRIAAPWMSDVVDVVEQQVDLALWIGDPWLRLRPLLLVGGAGTGKSHFARLLAETSGCALMQLPMGGDSDNRSLGGTSRGWLGAQPALPVVGMAQSGSANPVVILDEIDKVSPDKRNGNAHDTLLSMLEPVTAEAWYDRCLMSAVDLRHVVWIATANSTHSLPGPLLSRFDVVRVRAPGLDDVPGLLDRLRAEFGRRHGVPPATIPVISPAAETLLVAHFGRTRSLRQLQRGLDVALREAIRTMVRSVQ